jgi:hypothetical protein
MYSHLNLIINKLNSMGLTKLGDSDIMRKIISVLPMTNMQASSPSLTHMEDLSNMIPPLSLAS